MRVNHVPDAQEIRQARKLKYLELWPIEKQLEAFAENAAGRSEKLQQMLQDFAEVREAFSFYDRRGN